MTYFSIYWTSNCGQGTIPMSGEYDTDSLEEAISMAQAELLDQCGEEEQRQAVLAGTLAIVTG